MLTCTTDVTHFIEVKMFNQFPVVQKCSLHLFVAEYVAFLLEKKKERKKRKEKGKEAEGNRKKLPLQLNFERSERKPKRNGRKYSKYKICIS